MRPPAGVTEERKRPMTKAEILDAFVERMRTSSTGASASVELTRNAKGDVQIKVNVPVGSEADVATVEEAAAKARAVYETLAAFYPMPAAVPEKKPPASSSRAEK